MRKMASGFILLSPRLYLVSIPLNEFLQEEQQANAFSQWDQFCLRKNGSILKLENSEFLKEKCGFMVKMEVSGSFGPLCISSWMWPQAREFGTTRSSIPKDSKWIEFRDEPKKLKVATMAIKTKVGRIKTWFCMK